MVKNREKNPILFTIKYRHNIFRSLIFGCSCLCINSLFQLLLDLIGVIEIEREKLFCKYILICKLYSIQSAVFFNVSFISEAPYYRYQGFSKGLLT